MQSIQILVTIDVTEHSDPPKAIVTTMSLTEPTLKLEKAVQIYVGSLFNSALARSKQDFLSLFQPETD